MSKTYRTIICILIVIVCTIPYLLLKEQVKEMYVLGYIGIFLACFISNLSVLLPSSSTVIVITAATILNPVLCIVIGSFGASVGELSSYFCGRINSVKNNPHVESVILLRKIESWFEKYDYLTVFLFAVLPIPLFDLVGLLAGNSKMNIMIYSALTFLGKVVKYSVFVYIIAFLINNRETMTDWIN